MNTHTLLGPGAVYQPSSAGDPDLIAEAAHMSWVGRMVQVYRETHLQRVVHESWRPQ
jgi:hypothetical protein